MIVVDTSALLAIVLGEPGGPACREALRQAKAAYISAGTLAEALIVGGHRGVAQMLSALLEELQIEVVAVNAGDAYDVADGYRHWGRGMHPARLNLGDCFGYALAKSRRLPLLYVGEDFRRTDIVSAIT